MSQAPSPAAVRERAARVGIGLEDEACARIVAHAQCVLERNDELHLTSVTEPQAFLERHVGESLEGAACIDATLAGGLLDLGSGNGYPALPLVVARPALTPVLTEANRRKAAFLRDVCVAVGTGTVVHRQVQRPADVEELGELRIITTRAMGAWEKVLPRFADALAPDGVILLWAGEEVPRIAARKAWRRLSLVERRALPGRERSSIWILQRSI